MATAPSANDLTRQQLDELDSLLQRMLNLPLTGTEPPPPAPTGPTWRYDTPVAPPAPTPHLLAPPEPPRPQPAPVLIPPPRPQPVAEVIVIPPARTQPSVTAPVPLIPPPEPTTPIIERKPTPPPPKPAAPVVTAAPKPVSAPAAPTPIEVEPPPPPAPLVLLPLVGLNWVFDSLAGLFGPPGWLLRSGFGKNVLGLAGIGLIAYTAAHLASVAGVVQLPFPLPWPR